MYDFDSISDRYAGCSKKWHKYPNKDVIPLWVADMDIGLIGSGATLELHNGQSPPSLILYAGGNFLLSAMQFTE